VVSEIGDPDRSSIMRLKPQVFEAQKSVESSGSSLDDFVGVVKIHPAYLTKPADPIVRAGGAVLGVGLPRDMARLQVAIAGEQRDCAATKINESSSCIRLDVPVVACGNSVAYEPRANADLVRISRCYQLVPLVYVLAWCPFIYIAHATVRKDHALKPREVSDTYTRRAAM